MPRYVTSFPPEHIEHDDMFAPPDSVFPAASASYDVDGSVLQVPAPILIDQASIHLKDGLPLASNWNGNQMYLDAAGVAQMSHTDVEYSASNSKKLTYKERSRSTGLHNIYSLC